MVLDRLVLTFKPEELIVHALYRCKGDTNPGTKARAREVSHLIRTGLQDALRALETDVEMVGTSGFTTREDVLCIGRGFAPSGLHKKPPKKGAA